MDSRVKGVDGTGDSRFKLNELAGSLQGRSGELREGSPNNTDGGKNDFNIGIEFQDSGSGRTQTNIRQGRILDRIGEKGKKRGINKNVLLFDKWIEVQKGGRYYRYPYKYLI